MTPTDRQTRREAGRALLDAVGATWPPLRIELLGRFRVARGEHALADDAWRQHKAKALVKLLALAPDGRLPRDHLLDALWPDLDPAAAANNLYQALHLARRALATLGDDRANLLRLRGETVALAPPGALRTDVAAFEAALAAARRAPHPAALEAALALYAGDLLPEDRYEDWAAPRREVLRAAYLELLLALARAREERGEPAAAIAALARAVAHEPAHEGAHADLMRLYAHTGQRALALRQWARLNEALARELDAEPDPASRQLHGDILAGRFPRGKVGGAAGPAAGAPGRRQNLPAPLTSFVGRGREVGALAKLLADPAGPRLLTLTGAGGAGKTRLALAAAADLSAGDHYPDGFWLVELAPLADPALVPAAIARALGVREAPGHPLGDTLAATLRPKTLLLVLDNCEHLVAGCAALAATLLAAAPGLRVLATSREALRLPGERVWRVPSLQLPPDPADLPPAPSAGEEALAALAATEAVALLADRIRWRQPAFALTAENAPAVAAICRRLDGLPLALELAAARVPTLAPAQVAARLDDALALLTTGSRAAPSRQQTLRAALDWSHDLLIAPEQALLRRLAPFAGGFGLEAAEAVGAGAALPAAAVLELLAGLVDKSLVQVDEGPGEARYRLLETVRQYAAARLAASGEADEVHARHAAHYLALAEEAELSLAGPEQARWLNQLEQEGDNLRAALRWADMAAQIETEARLCAALWRFWYHRSHLVEGERWLAGALARDGVAALPVLTRARLLHGAGALARNRGDLGRAGDLSYQALALYQEAGDRGRIAASLHNLGTVAEQRCDYNAAARLYEEGLRLWEELGDKLGAANTVGQLGNLARERGDLVQAYVLHERSLALHREIGNTRGIAFALGGLGTIALDEGDYARAVALYEENLALHQELGDRSSSALAQHNLGLAIAYRGDGRRGAVLQAASLRLAQEAGDRRMLACGLEGLAVATAQGEGGTRGAALAARLYGTAEGLRSAMGLPLPTADQVLFERPLAAARAILGEEAWAAALAAGRAQPLDEALVDAFAVADALATATTAPPDTLTRRERELAGLVARGHTNAQIAAALGMAERTAATHVGNILRKLGLASRVEVAAWARAQGLGPTTGE